MAAAAAATFASCNKAGAIKQYAQHLRQNPGDIKSRWMKAEAHSIIRENTGATAEYRQIQQRTTNAADRETAGVLSAYHDSRAKGEASRALMQAVTQLQGITERHGTCSQAFYWHGIFTDGTSSLQKAVDLEPNNYWFRTMLANRLEEEGELSSAKVQYEAALQIEPSVTLAHLALARFDLQERKMPQFHARFSKAFDLNKLLTLQWAREHKQELDAAGFDVNKWPITDETASFFVEKAAEIDAKEVAPMIDDYWKTSCDLNEAEAKLRKAIEKRPTAFGNLALAKCLLIRGRPDEAAYAFQQANRLDQTVAANWLFSGRDRLKGVLVRELPIQVLQKLSECIPSADENSDGAINFTANVGFWDVVPVFDLTTRDPAETKNASTVFIGTLGQYRYTLRSISTTKTWYGADYPTLEIRRINGRAIEGKYEEIKIRLSPGSV